MCHVSLQWLGQQLNHPLGGQKAEIGLHAMELHADFETGAASDDLFRQIFVTWMRAVRMPLPGGSDG
jgi:hypothetical protein